jgi:N utilization substance protein A
MKMERTFDTDAIRLITVFENITGAPVKDCIVSDEAIYFLIEEGKVGIAIGKNGNNIKHAEKMIGKSIKVFEFSSDISKFLKNMIPQANMIKITNGSEVVVEIKVDKTDRGLVIGRDGRNLKLFKEFLQRSHGINNLVVK